MGTHVRQHICIHICLYPMGAHTYGYPHTPIFIVPTYDNIYVPIYVMGTHICMYQHTPRLISEIPTHAAHGSARSSSATHCNTQCISPSGLRKAPPTGQRDPLDVKRDPLDVQYLRILLTANQKRPIICQKTPITCQKRPIPCQKRPITCQKRTIGHPEFAESTSHISKTDQSDVKRDPLHDKRDPLYVRYLQKISITYQKGPTGRQKRPKTCPEFAENICCTSKETHQTPIYVCGIGLGQKPKKSQMRPMATYQ